MRSAPHSRKLKINRQPGRPAGASTVMRQCLLDAAVALFAERGAEATTLRAICAQAGVTPGLLHYYFSNKEALIDALLKERIAPLVAISSAPLIAQDLDPLQALIQFLRSHIENIASHPWLPPLIVREVIGSGILRDRILAQTTGAIAARLDRKSVV